MAKNAGKFLELEGLRGVLALLVVVYHLGLNTVLERFGLHFGGWLSVDVFFALSGFVLAHTYYGGKRSAEDFALGRIARLYPLHVLTTLVMLTLAKHPPSAADLGQQFATIHNLGLPPYADAINGPAWSISVEIWVSVLFFALLTKWRPWALVAILAASLPMLALNGTYEGGPINNGLLRGLVGFSVGCLAYRARDVYGERLRMPAPVAYAALAMLGATMLDRSLSTVRMAAFYGITAALLVGLSGNARTVLSSRPAVWLGTVSYSIYLWHSPILAASQAAFGESVRGVGGKVAILTAVLAAGWASYRWIEKPAQVAILAAARARVLQRVES